MVESVGRVGMIVCGRFVGVLRPLCCGDVKGRRQRKVEDVAQVGVKCFGGKAGVKRRSLQSSGPIRSRSQRENRGGLVGYGTADRAP